MVDKFQTFEIEKCFICGAPLSIKYRDLNDRIFGNSKGWTLCECDNSDCKLLALNPSPSKESIGMAYENYYTHSTTKKSSQLLDKLEKAYQKSKYGYEHTLSFTDNLLAKLLFFSPTLRNKFDFNIQYLHWVPNGKVLDFGCGNGWILDNLRSVGWDCYGLDFDEKAVSHCQSKGLNVQKGDIASLKCEDNYFDAIIVNHVIEHIYDIDDFLKDCYKKLKPGGKLVIATPNSNSWQHRYLYKKNWMQLDAPRHLNIFNPQNLTKVVERNGMKKLSLFTSFRADAWVSIVSRNLQKRAQFIIGKDKKSITDLILGLFHEKISVFLSFFDKYLSDEVVIIAGKR